MSYCWSSLEDCDCEYTEGVLDTKEQVELLRKRLEDGTEEKYKQLDEARRRAAELATKKYLR